MNNSTFEMSVQLPQIGTMTPASVVTMLDTGLLDLRTTCKNAFIGILSDHVSSGRVKRFKEITSQQTWTFNSAFPETPEPDLPPLGPVDLCRIGDFEVDFLGFEIAIPRGGNLALPTQLGDYRKSVPFITVNPPWQTQLYRASVRELRTQDNLAFKFSLRLAFPIFDAKALIPVDRCVHQFRIVEFGDWQWRLLWECSQCGLVCHCSCFERAIKSDPFPSEMSGIWPEFINAKPNRIPFVPRACEFCRDLPSSHRFCRTDYASSLFEARYGAYVWKRRVEMILEGQHDLDDRQVENTLRAELGFPEIGKPGFTETELCRIIKAIFPDDVVQRRVRPAWLDGLEVDILVPSRNLAIEFHGPQHFAPVWPHRDESAFNKAQERDGRKRSLLAANGFTLCEFSNEDTIDMASVQRRIRRILQARA